MENELASTPTVCPAGIYGPVLSATCRRRVKLRLESGQVHAKTPAFRTRQRVAHTATQAA
jgi:hypothetical protein